jgi:hypothetical protein
MSKTTININGRTYDAVTGEPVGEHAVRHSLQSTQHHDHPPHKSLRAFSDIGPTTNVNQLHKPERPVADAHLAPVKPAHEVHAPAQHVHQVTQKSQTLYRRALKKPAVRPTIPTPTAHQRSPLVSHFTTPQAVPLQEQPMPLAPEQDTPPVMHPAVAKALQQQTDLQPSHTQELTSKELKDQLIKERLAEVENAPAKKEKKAGWLSRQPRLVTILTSTLALLILGGYLTYITLPSISLKVAASRAGVNAVMPEYKPDGYSLDGPITYSPGEVVISYKSNTNDTGYKLVQKATNWDSQAVLDNYVGKLTDNYLTFQERGVTVYTFGSKAAWVNGGLLYTIDGNAGLSSDQILHLATSL